MGRPKRLRKKVITSDPVLLKFEPSDLRALKMWAEEEHRPLANLLRHIIKTALEERAG